MLALKYKINCIFLKTYDNQHKQRCAHHEEISWDISFSSACLVSHRAERQPFTPTANCSNPEPSCYEVTVLLQLLHQCPIIFGGLSCFIG